MSTKTATIAGATGLTGHSLLQHLLQDDYFDTIRILVRKPFAFTHPKLEPKLVDFNDADSLLTAISGSDALFCCIGTTQKKVKGDKAAYRKVDYDIPVTLARLCKIDGCENFLVISSVGANSQSRNFYLRLKGEMENAVKESGLQSVHIFQPSLLIGERNERRLAEKVSQVIMKRISFLFPAKYRAVEATDLARAMLETAQKQEPGVHTYRYKDIKSLIV